MTSGEAPLIAPRSSFVQYSTLTDARNATSADAGPAPAAPNPAAARRLQA
jgi:hypothetical protein